MTKPQDILLYTYLMTIILLYSYLIAKYNVRIVIDGREIVDTCDFDKFSFDIFILKG